MRKLALALLSAATLSACGFVNTMVDGLKQNKPLRELAETVRTAVTGEFKQAPENIVLGFSLGKSAPGKRVQAQ